MSIEKKRRKPIKAATKDIPPKSTEDTNSLNVKPLFTESDAADGGLEAIKIQLQRVLEEQKKANQEQISVLQESSERLNELQTLLDNAPLAVWIARDPECLNITGNIYANRLFGVGRGDNISKSAQADEVAVIISEDGAPQSWGQGIHGLPGGLSKGGREGREQ